MAQHSTSGHVVYREERLTTKEALRAPGRQAYQVLHWAYVALPLVVGIDKFLHRMTNWDAYLAPQLASLSPFSDHVTMRISGAFEIAMSLVVALKPKIGAWMVTAWLAGIIFDLALLGDNWDIAFRDFGLMLGAIALARFAVAHERHETV
ncbi:MAG: hypothetical protein ACXVEF_17855 [Polyangiales bacterium]